MIEGEQVSSLYNFNNLRKTFTQPIAQPMQFITVVVVVVLTKRESGSLVGNYYVLHSTF